jgi:type I restriction enzyme, S subunit
MKKKFAEFVTLQRGFDLPKADMHEGSFPVVGSTSIIGYHDEYKVEPPGVVTGRSGSLGTVQFINERYWPHNTSLWVKDFKGNDPRFVFYRLQGFDFARFNAGAGVPTLNRNHLDTLEVDVPQLPVQRRIAGILSAYDDLIENNQRRIKILEEMARSLYREWFVHFRFPGHDKNKMVPSSLGPIPQGWEVKSLADLCESVSYGYTASAVREEIGPKFLRITDIVPDVIEWDRVPFCEIPPGKAPKYLVKRGDIVIARTGATTGYAKRLNKRHPETVFASYLVRVRAHADVSNLMLGLLAESADYKKFIKANIGGAAQPQANAVVLTSMRIAAPPSPLCKKFDHLVEPLFDEAELLAIKVQNLRRTRALLLPRLLSGEVNLAKAGV